MAQVIGREQCKGQVGEQRKCLKPTYLVVKATDTFNFFERYRNAYTIVRKFQYISAYGTALTQIVVFCSPDIQHSRHSVGDI
jgi:hypothetical protein